MWRPLCAIFIFAVDVKITEVPAEAISNNGVAVNGVGDTSAAASLFLETAAATLVILAII